tara:strand:+ start:706 stop:1128 length:423 start_codon:yes stop_codon:yes gene_type:complete
MTIGSKLEGELQEALDRGWTEFQSSEEYRMLEKAFDWLVHTSGFYESGFRGVIPHPAYDNAARYVGKHFVTVARTNGICFDPGFPGQYSASEEVTKGDMEYRTFNLEPFRVEDPLGLWKVTFAHSHERLYFPQPPQLEVA